MRAQKALALGTPTEAGITHLVAHFRYISSMYKEDVELNPGQGLYGQERARDMAQHLKEIRFSLERLGHIQEVEG